MSIRWIVRNWRTLGLWRMPYGIQLDRFHACTQRVRTLEFGGIWLGGEWFLVSKAARDLNTGEEVTLKLF